jgi:hypothetical protein
MRFLNWCLTPLVAVALAGCANIHAKKVPIEDRIAGTDDQKGFRYYLSRPYVVVAKAVPIATEVEEAELVQLRNAAGVEMMGLKSTICLPGQPGRPRLYDRSGNPLNSEEWSLVRTFTNKAANVGPPANPPKAALGPPVSEDLAANRPTGPGGTDDVPGIQVVMLPDFEEQMAIRDRNFAAKSAYDLHFTDGWQLDSVNGAWNSTELPVRILQSIGKVIRVAEALQLQALQAPAASFAAPTAHAQNFAGRPIIVNITRRYYLEPGIYRVQKSWEKHPAECTTVGAAAGLLTDLGLEVRQAVQIDLAPGKP